VLSQPEHGRSRLPRSDSGQSHKSHACRKCPRCSAAEAIRERLLRDHLALPWYFTTLHHRHLGDYYWQQIEAGHAAVPDVLRVEEATRRPTCDTPRIALFLAQAGCVGGTLLYAQAALDNCRTVSPGATDQIRRTQALIRELEKAANVRR
jgi:hypothetical protein